MNVAGKSRSDWDGQRRKILRHSAKLHGQYVDMVVMGCIAAGLEILAFQLLTNFTVFLTIKFIDHHTYRHPYDET